MSYLIPIEMTYYICTYMDFMDYMDFMNYWILWTIWILWISWIIASFIISNVKSKGYFDLVSQSNRNDIPYVEYFSISYLSISVSSISYLSIYCIFTKMSPFIISNVKWKGYFDVVSHSNRNDCYKYTDFMISYIWVF